MARTATKGSHVLGMDWLPGDQEAENSVDDEIEDGEDELVPGWDEAETEAFGQSNVATATGLQRTVLAVLQNLPHPGNVAAFPEFLVLAVLGYDALAHDSVEAFGEPKQESEDGDGEEDCGQNCCTDTVSRLIRPSKAVSELVGIIG